MQQLTADQPASAAIPPAQALGARRFRTLRVVAALIMRETGSRESTTSLGFLWTFIEPIAQTILLTVFFSLMMRKPALGTNFELFYITGVGTFQVFSQTQGKVASAIRFSRPLLGFPAVTVIDALLARFLLGLFTSTVTFFLLFEGAMAYYQLRDQPNYALVLLSLTMAASVGLGVGTMNAVLFLASPVYESFYHIISRPLSIASGSMFLISTLPANIFQYLWWNPLVHTLGEMRHAVYPAYDASYINIGYAFLFAAICFTVGLIGLHRYVFDALER